MCARTRTRTCTCTALRMLRGGVSQSFQKNGSLSLWQSALEIMAATRTHDAGGRGLGYAFVLPALQYYGIERNYYCIDRSRNFLFGFAVPGISKCL